MKKMTSAYANKVLKSLDEDKAYWLTREADDSTYTACVDEEPVIPEYDYKTVAATIDELDRKICIIRHAINKHNSAAEISVGDQLMSVDMILVRMSQLNRRKAVLDVMRKRQPKSREVNAFASRKTTPEYCYLNYDLELVKQDYERVCDRIMEMQIALDRFNQTVEFDVDL